VLQIFTGQLAQLFGSSEGNDLNHQRNCVVENPALTDWLF